MIAQAQSVNQTICEKARACAKALALCDSFEFTPANVDALTHARAVDAELFEVIVASDERYRGPLERALCLADGE